MDVHPGMNRPGFPTRPSAIYLLKCLGDQFDTGTGLIVLGITNAYVRENII